MTTEEIQTQNKCAVFAKMSETGFQSGTAFFSVSLTSVVLITSLKNTQSEFTLATTSTTTITTHLFTISGW